jgi:superfamily I DNA/RNA helicase
MIATIKADRKCSDSDAKKTLKYQKLEDNCKCIENICLHSIKDVRELKTYIDKMFTDERVKNAVMLSTAHKSKGLEANRVLILLPNKMPLNYPQQKEWQLKQEMNLKYVAITRARKELIFVDMTEQQLIKANLNESKKTA